MSDRQVVVVDGANVAHEETSKDGKARVANIVRVVRELEELGYEPIVIADASLRHRVDDPVQLEALIDRGRVHQVPAGTDADYFVLEFAEQYDALVVSNDTYRDRQERYPWIRRRRVPLMILDGTVQLYEENLSPARSA